MRAASSCASRVASAWTTSQLVSSRIRSTLILVVFQDDELRGLALQLTSHGATHASGAADDVVPLQPADLSFHFSPAKQIVEFKFQQCLAQCSQNQEHQSDTGKDDAHIEVSSRLRKRVYLPVADGGQGGEHHVEAVKPAPVLDKVEACRADDGYAQQAADKNLTFRNARISALAAIVLRT